MKWTGLILTGGKSSRMGEDKATMSFHGKPLAHYSTELLRLFCDEILVASDKPEHTVFGDRRIEDRYPNSGPLAGLHAGLSEAKTDQLLVLSCDVPLVSPAVIQAFIVREGNFDARVASCNDRIHPLIGCYYKPALKTIEQKLKAGQLKLRECLDAIAVDIVPFPKSYETAFQNMNTPNDISLWEEV